MNHPTSQERATLCALLNTNIPSPMAQPLIDRTKSSSTLNSLQDKRETYTIPLHLVSTVDVPAPVI